MFAIINQLNLDREKECGSHEGPGRALAEKRWRMRSGTAPGAMTPAAPAAPPEDPRRGAACH